MDTYQGNHLIRPRTRPNDPIWKILDTHNPSAVARTF